MILSTKDGKKLNAEIVCTFNIDKFQGQYVIYKVNSQFYGAKYINQENMSTLITDLSHEEQDAISKIFLQYKKEGIIND